ncbi:MAG TPA: hypothetical protein VGN69_05780 [Solirubrobacteraceae bacterium]|nr:hypothetical protein [Solirubrobacteraceae bacterium]
MRRLVVVLYLVIGAVVASQHHYYTQLHSASQIASAVLATLGWPLVLAHVNVDVRLDGR